MKSWWETHILMGNTDSYLVICVWGTTHPWETHAYITVTLELNSCIAIIAALTSCSKGTNPFYPLLYTIAAGNSNGGSGVQFS